MSADRLRSTLGSLQLVNPIVCGSGEHVMTEAGIRAALATGVAGVIAKSINEARVASEQLDRADYTLLDAAGDVVTLRPAPPQDARAESLFCRSGLAGHAPEEWFDLLARLDDSAHHAGQFVAASIVLGGAEAAAHLAKLAQRRRLRVLELNIGAPHATEVRAGAITMEADPARVTRAVQLVRREFSGALWIKLSGMSEDIGAISKAASGAGADAVVVAGRSMAFVPDTETLQPVLGTFAAYGGQWAVPITCRTLALARRALGGRTPLVGTNGARTANDVARMLLAGASAVEMASVVFTQGFDSLRRVRDDLAHWLERKDLTLRDIVGRAADAVGDYAQQPLHAGRWRAFVPPESR